MTERGDRWSHLIVYLIAGGAMGGFLDVTAFRMPTPVYGILTGCVIALLFFAVVARPWKKH